MIYPPDMEPREMRSTDIESSCWVSSHPNIVRPGSVNKRASAGRVED